MMDYNLSLLLVLAAYARLHFKRRISMRVTETGLLGMFVTAKQ